MPGDLLFYKATDVLTRLVAWGTNGPFAHVAIDIGGGRVVEALPTGIHLGPPTSANPILYVTRPLPSHLSPALGWLRQQVGHGYGWEDIAGDVLRVLGLPVFWLPPTNEYDCSDLATRFLARVNPRLVGPLAQNPRLVSPNALAKKLGVH